MNLFKITLKPALRVKKKKGKRYVQIKNVYGDLIHIGPASDLDSWRIAFLALEEEYHTLVMTERALLFPIIKREGLSVSQALEPINQEGNKWNTYNKKCDRKFDERQKEIAELEKELGQSYPKTPWELRPVLERLRQKRRKETFDCKPK